ncbi:MAG TPA: STAS domain-containing protein [Bryobacteraceae bacterium]|nr:STAS domain-containing protein [Bryobacteraceae bacterium]
MAPSNCTVTSRETVSRGARPASIEIERQGEVCILRCHGSLLAGLDADYVLAKIEDIKQLNCSRVLADFQAVPAIGSTGIAFIVGVYTYIVRISGGRFVVTGAAPMVQRVLEITRLNTVIPLAADLGSGLAVLRS